MWMTVPVVPVRMEDAAVIKSTDSTAVAKQDSMEFAARLVNKSTFLASMGTAKHFLFADVDDNCNKQWAGKDTPGQAKNAVIVLFCRPRVLLLILYV